jgi:translation initiation factor 2 beta subunit (eIF-2beta)/eIF-5
MSYQKKLDSIGIISNGEKLSKQSNRNKILEKFADHILRESCPHCQHIVRQALIVEDEEYYKMHCKKCGGWLEGNSVCSECG